MNALVPRSATDVVEHRERLWYADVPRSGAKATLAGYFVMLAGVGGFAGWALTAPIEGAVLTPGYFVATTQNKIVQHLEGGIIQDIAVREGEVVGVGQPLLKLDDTAAKGELRRLELRHAELSIAEARLRAEASGADTAIIPDRLTKLAATDADLQTAIKNQLSIFSARFQRLSSDIGIQNQAIASLTYKIKGDTERKNSVDAQLTIIAEELADKQDLRNKGLVRKPEFLAMRRLQANLRGEAARLTSEIGESEERIKANQQQIKKLANAAIEQAVEELQKTVSELKDVTERMTSARDVLDRMLIRSPVAGAVVKLNYHTPGGVIRAGNDILALLPSGDELVIETRVRPQDIDNVRVGLKAYIRLTALNQRTTPMLPGDVVYVSADAVPNERRNTDENIYIARIRLDRASAALVENFVPTPGMPAEVYIKTRDRTFFKYLIQPILDTMARAFREA